MAFTATHRAEFTDRHGTDWKVDILQDVVQGAIATLQVTGDPLHIEWLAASDDILANPIKGSTATLNLECETNFQYIGFYSSEEMVYKMRVYKATVLYWEGWISTDYTEPYDPAPYTVSLTAVDGLGMLRDITYKDAGVVYPGHDEQEDIILIILNKIGYWQFTEYCNIYEDRMNDAAADSLFTQVLTDNDVFTGMDCYAVLEAILKPYHAVIRQQDGGMVIYRPLELIGDTVLGRIVKSYEVTATSITPDQFLARTGTASNIIDVLGGVLMYTPPLSKFTALQDYGYKESWIDNRTFNPETFTIGPPGTFEEWTIVGPDIFHPLQYLTNEPEGLVINPYDAGYILQEFGDYARASAGDVFSLEFDYKLRNATGADITPAHFHIAVYCGTPPNYLKHPASDDNIAVEWTSVATLLTITEATAAKGESQWKTWTRAVATMPDDGPLTIVFYPRASLYLCINNVRFIATSDNLTSLKRKKNWARDLLTKIRNPTLVSLIYGTFAPIANWMLNTPRSNVAEVEEIVEHLYYATNAINGQETSESYILGDVIDTGIDNVIEQFKGALVLSVTGSLTQTALDFAIDFAADYLVGGVVLTSNGPDIIFTAAVAGTDFSAPHPSSIVNATGTLDGTAATVAPGHVHNAVGAKQKDTITLTSALSSGSCNIVIGLAGTYPLDWTAPTLDTTAAQFVTDYATDLNDFYSITCTSSGADIILEALSEGYDWGTTTITNVAPDLAGSVVHVAAATATKRVDTITLTGTSGTATVTCDGVAKTVTYNAGAVLDYTASWHTRGNTEELRVLQIIANERALLYSKGRQFLQLSLEEDAAATSFNMIGNLQDPLNLSGANYRVFVPNRGSLDVRNRAWIVDLMEIGDKA